MKTTDTHSRGRRNNRKIRINDFMIMSMMPNTLLLLFVALYAHAEQRAILFKSFPNNKCPNMALGSDVMQESILVPEKMPLQLTVPQRFYNNKSFFLELTIIQEPSFLGVRWISKTEERRHPQQKASMSWVFTLKSSNKLRIMGTFCPQYENMLAFGLHLGISSTHTHTHLKPVVTCTSTHPRKFFLFRCVGTGTSLSGSLKSCMFGV